MQQKYLLDIGPTSDDGETLPRFLPTPTAGISGGERSGDRKGTGDLKFMARTGVLTSLPVVSLAKTSAMPDAATDLKVSEADCFSKLNCFTPIFSSLQVKGLKTPLHFTSQHITARHSTPLHSTPRHNTSLHVILFYASLTRQFSTDPRSLWRRHFESGRSTSFEFSLMRRQL